MTLRSPSRPSDPNLHSFHDTAHRLTDPTTNLTAEELKLCGPRRVGNLYREHAASQKHGANVPRDKGADNRIPFTKHAADLRH